MREVHHFIGGKSVSGTSGRFGDIYNPNTGEVQARVALATEAELDAAVANGDVAAIERALRAGLSPDTFMAHVTLLCRAASVT